MTLLKKLFRECQTCKGIFGTHEDKDLCRRVRLLQPTIKRRAIERNMEIMFGRPSIHVLGE